MGRSSKKPPDTPQDLDELIDQLQTLRNEHGNLSVLVCQDGSLYAASTLYYASYSQEYELSEYGLKQAVILESMSADIISSFKTIK